ncbi:MAG TPA: 2-oxoacid:ferredoxin oxidoreductase subunit beta, partial [Anaerolineaceae bacterium]|nr:2-oxoacid:ferredoxin oxidoreductase subunit beta [Anaerolineaceae bacterium]
KWQALRMLEDAEQNNWLLTGLIYIEPETPTIFDKYNLPDTPLNRLANDKLRPSRKTFDRVNDMMF